LIRDEFITVAKVKSFKTLLLQKVVVKDIEV